MDPFIAEIIMFGGNFAPRGWALCDGQLLPISQYSALFSILGTTYGGDGRTTFGLPDLRGRSPVHAGDGPGLSQVRLGEKGGSATTTLAIANLPAHSHNQRGAEEDANSADPGGNVCATTEANAYHAAADANMGATSNVGNNQAFDNRSPFLVVNFIIALVGTFPSRN